MLIIDTADKNPIYVQIYQQIKNKIMSGELSAETRLSSVRELAVELSISRNTVESAYQELIAEGYIHTRPRAGYFVSALDHNAASNIPRQTQHHEFTQPKDGLNFTYDFHPARLDPNSFPASLWRRIYTECLRESSGHLAQYSEPQGEWELRSALQKYLEQSRGVVCAPDQIVICAGLQHSLDIVAHLLKNTHPVAAIEDPGYPLPWAVLRNHGFDIVPISVGHEGINIDKLKHSNSSLVYVTPSHQFPLGHVMPIGNRLRLIEWAKSRNNYIIEDDYDSELRYLGKPIPSLQGLHPHGNIIYTGTFSKVFSPALRISYMVLPPTLLHMYHEHFRNYQTTTSVIEQKALARFMGQGHWDKHIRRVRTTYKKRQTLFISSIDRHFGTLGHVTGYGAGLHVVLQLPNIERSENQIIARARTMNINLFPFSETRTSGKQVPTTLLLGFGGIAPEEIDAGIEQLFHVCFG